MSVLRNDYDLETHVDEVWYESSNVIYSKFTEGKEENNGTLEVVFKGGKRYEYKEVMYIDYLSFKRGLVDGSSGKAFNEYIIKKYKGERMDDVSIDELMNRLHAPKEEEVTYFIHGDGKLDEEIFKFVYSNAISYALDSTGSRFATQYFDEYGMRSAQYLYDCKVNLERMTIYIPESEVQNLDEKFHVCRLVKIKDEEYDRDFIDKQILKRSFEDISYITEDKAKEIAKISRDAYLILTRRMG